MTVNNGDKWFFCRERFFFLKTVERSNAEVDPDVGGSKENTPCTVSVLSAV